MIELTKKQSDLWRQLDNTDYRRYLIDGGARSGKTITIIGWLLSQMVEHPGIRIAVLRQHRNHARTTLYEGTIRMLLRDRSDFTMMDTSMEVKHGNGSIMRLDGLDDADRIDKILGDEFGHIFINEATQISYKALQIAISRLSQSLPTLKKRNLIMDCNPKSTMHWLYLLGVQHLNPETREPIKDAPIWTRMNFSPLDNPYLPDDAVASLEALSGIERQRLYDGVWANLEGLVYSGFNADKHVVHKDVTDAEGWLVGVDCGTNDPMILALFAIIKNEKGLLSLHMDELYYKSGKDMSVSLADVAEKWRDKDAFYAVDPSASPAIVELRARGFRVEPAKNKIKEGVTIVNDLINTDRITIEPSCSRQLLEELMQYEVNPKTDLPFDNTPDHILDALRYTCFAFLGDQYGAGSNVYIF